MIEVRPTLLPRYRAHARFDLDLTFNPRRAMFMTKNTQQLKFKGQLVQKTEWKETDRQTLPTAFPLQLTWLVTILNT